MADQTNTTILDIKVNNSAAVAQIAHYTKELETLKATQTNLKKQIKETGDQDGEYRKSLVATEALIKQQKDGIRSLTKELTNNVKAEREQEGSLTQMKQRLSALTQQYNDMGKAARESTQGEALKTQIADLTTELTDAEKELGNFHRQVGNYEIAGKSLRNEMRELTEQVTNLKFQGKENTEEYKNAITSLAKMKDAMADVNQEAGNLANDTQKLTTFSQAITTGVAAMSAYQSVLGYFNVDAEQSVEIIRKMQSLQLLLTAATQIQNAAQKQSNVYMLASNVMKALHIKQTEAQIVATGQLTVAQRVMNAVMKANPVYLLIGAITALVAAFVALKAAVSWITSIFSSGASATERATAASKEYEEQTKKTEEAIKKLNEAEKVEIAQMEQNTRRRLLELKQNGATEQEIAAETLKSENNVRQAQINNSKARVAELSKELAAAQAKQKAEDAIYNGTVENLTKFGFSTDEINEKTAEQKKIVEEVTAKVLELNAAISDETIKQGNLGLSIQEANQKANDETIKQDAEAAKQRASEAAAAAKERRDKETAETRAAVDAQLGIMKAGLEKELAVAKEATKRRIEDLKKRLATEKNLTTAAREAINKQIEAAEIALQQQIFLLKDENLNKEIEKQAAAIQQRLEIVRKGSEDEHNLKLEQIDNEKRAAVAAAQKNGQDISLVLQKYNQQIEDENAAYRKATLQKTIDETTATWEDKITELKLKAEQEKADGADGETTDEATRQAELELKVQQKKEELDALNQAELEGMEIGNAQKLEALKAYNDAVAALEKNETDTKIKQDEKQKKAQDAKERSMVTSMRAIANAVGALGNIMAEDTAASKILGLAQIAINTGIAIANAMKQVKSPNAWDYAAQVATIIATSMSAMVQAKRVLSTGTSTGGSGESTRRAFATGGYVSGAGTATSDSIPAQLSNGESVLNANATSMFAPLLSTLNQIGGGVPIQASQTAASVDGTDALAASLAKALAAQPSPIVAVEDINAGQKRVKIIETRNSL